MWKFIKKNFLPWIAILIFSACVLYTFGYIFIAALILDNPTFSYTSYRKISNWDNTVHSFDQDLDYDGNNDFVTFTGCVFLTKTKIENIPYNQRCTADQITKIFKETFSPVPVVGQRYLSPKDNNFNLDSQYYPHYTYLFEKNKHWYLVTVNQEGTTMYSIDTQGLLTKVPLALDHQIHILLYKISETALAPLLYLTWLGAFHF